MAGKRRKRESFSAATALRAWTWCDRIARPDDPMHDDWAVHAERSGRLLEKEFGREYLVWTWAKIMSIRLKEARLLAEGRAPLDAGHVKAIQAFLTDSEKVKKMHEKIAKDRQRKADRAAEKAAKEAQREEADETDEDAQPEAVMANEAISEADLRRERDQGFVEGYEFALRRGGLPATLIDGIIAGTVEPSRLRSFLAQRTFEWDAKQVATALILEHRGGFTPNEAAQLAHIDARDLHAFGDLSRWIAARLGPSMAELATRLRRWRLPEDWLTRIAETLKEWQRPRLVVVAA